MKENKTIKTISIAVISILIITIIGLGIYTMFIKKDDNQGSNNNQNNIVEKIYKTKDGKFSLKVVDSNDEKAIEDAKKESEAFSGGYNVAGYAYLNDDLLFLLDIKEDDFYASYSAVFPGRGGQYDEVFLVDKQNGQIVEQKDFSKENYDDLEYDEGYYRFNGEGNLITFVKTNAGYFFAKVLDGPYDIDIVEVYTTTWKEIGYASLNDIKSDSDGIYVYKNFDDDYNLSGSTTKYDVNGYEIN